MTNQSPILNFAREELSRFLPNAAMAIELQINPSLADHSFSGQRSGDGLVLSGWDETCVLHAVYTFLEQMGLRFEITGPVRLEKENLADFKAFSITPAVNQRGIRQHINFPMDISSYTLEEAGEYIRNLARLRYNHISFHSYPNQWIDGEQNSELKTAGAFFYGQRHDIPNHPLLQKVIHNSQTYCIPDIEPYFHDPETKSTMAITWLQAVMVEAKRCGLTIQFSFEPRQEGKDVGQTLTTCRHLLELYPLMDTLELISAETGGWGEANDEATVRKALNAYYSEELQSGPEFTAAIESGKANFDTIMAQLGHLLSAVQAFKEEAAEKKVTLALGIYCVLPTFHPAILRVVRERLPKEFSFAFLPEHSSGRVADAMAEIQQEDADWQRTLLYSWLEFDGTMYLQQNGVSGLERLLTNLQGKVQGMAFNHWRTAENQLVARYAAEACLYGSIPAKAFYVTYAENLRIGNPESFAKAHQLMAEADWMAINELFNIGFCYAGCWGRKGLGYFANWPAERILVNHNLFEETHRLLGECAKKTTAESGRSFLSLLDNRVRCTMVYLKAMAKGSELQKFKDKEPDDLTAAEKKELVHICDAAIALLEQYMALHAQAMPDRGCEGTLISLYHTPPAVLKRIREEYAGIPNDQPHADSGHDEPPSPIEW